MRAAARERSMGPRPAAGRRSGAPTTSGPIGTPAQRRSQAADPGNRRRRDAEAPTMTALFAKAPTLAWLLAALACFLAGLAVGEGRHPAAAVPALAPVGVVVTVEVAWAPPAGPEPTPSPASAVALVASACLAEGLPHPEP
jgi:hypothetical protein